MSVIVTSPAPSDVTARRHVLLAMGSGLTGLAATKALKLAQLNITDAAVFVGGIATRWFSHFARVASPLTPVMPAVITSGVLVALAVIGVADIVKLPAAEPGFARTARRHERAHSTYAQLCGVRDLERKVG